MVSRETKQVRVAPSSGVTGSEIVKRAIRNVDAGATIYHDDYRPYGVLDGSFRHESVNHSAGEYARGDVHTNTIEGVLRPWLQTFRGISNEQAYLYCAHYQHLRSRRDAGRVDRALSMFCLSLSPRPDPEGGLDFGDPVSVLPIAFDVPSRG